MRLIFRVALLTLIAFGSSGSLLADHLVADCPLAFIGAVPATPGSTFGVGPHAIFRNGSLVYVLRGSTLTTLNVTDIGDIQLARPEDPIPAIGREVDGGVVYHNGFMYVSTEAGLEVFDLRTTRGGTGGTGPIFVTRVPGAHYRRLAASGNFLAGLFPMGDIPCSPSVITNCGNSIDIYNIVNPATLSRVGRIEAAGTAFIGFEDIAFANGFLYATGMGGTVAFSLANAASPSLATSNSTVGRFLVTNGTNLLGVGQETLIGIFSLGPGALMTALSVVTLPSIVDRANDLRFHPEAWFDGPRLITLIDEVDPMNRPQQGVTGRSARTLAFDVFDLTVPMFDGFDDRIYENVSFTFPDEVKHDPIAVGGFVYVLGEISGMQKYGVCGQIAGRIEFDTIQALACGGAEIRGWVTGTRRITSVELFLDGTLLGNAALGRPRTDIHVPTEALAWRVSVNLDQTAAGLRTLRAIATDAAGNRRQFSSVQLQFPGPPNNCTSRRRLTKR